MSAAARLPPEDPPPPPVAPVEAPLATVLRLPGCDWQDAVHGECGRLAATVIAVPGGHQLLCASHAKVVPAEQLPVKRPNLVKQVCDLAERHASPAATPRDAGDVFAPVG